MNYFMLPSISTPLSFYAHLDEIRLKEREKRERPSSAVADPIQSAKQCSLGPPSQIMRDQSATEGGSPTIRYVAATRDEGNAADDA